MKKITALLALMLLVFTLGACTGGTTDDAADTTGETTTEEVAEEVVEETGPIVFADVGKGIMDAKEDFDHFTFEEWEGTCVDQEFPTNIIYTSANMIKTVDEEYVEDLTSVDFTGRIRFDEVPLTSGAAECTIKTTSGVTKAELTCSVEEEEVCTATMKVYAQTK